MKLIYPALILLLLLTPIAAQSDLDKMIETEHAFAQMASDKGTKAAFLEYMAPDAVVFEPGKVNARVRLGCTGRKLGASAFLGAEFCRYFVKRRAWLHDRQLGISAKWQKR